MRRRDCSSGRRGAGVAALPSVAGRWRQPPADPAAGQGTPPLTITDVK